MNQSRRTEPIREVSSTCLEHPGMDSQKTSIHGIIWDSNYLEFKIKLELEIFGA